MTDELYLPDQGDGSYRNPVLCCDYSDPDVIRVGDTYYMTASSFNYVPGLPILTSADLVNWRLVNYALPNIPEPGYEIPRHACGVWAPAIRWHDGFFYTDPFHSKNCGNCGNSTSFINNINIQDISLVDKSGRSGVDGVAVISGVGEHIIEGFCLKIVNRAACLDQHLDVFVQHMRDVLMVFEADLLPHDRGGGGDTCDILKTSRGQPLHDLIL